MKIYHRLPIICANEETHNLHFIAGSSSHSFVFGILSGTPCWLPRKRHLEMVCNWNRMTYKFQANRMHLFLV